MKRSEINQAIKDAKQIMAQYRFSLPKFAEFSAKDWQIFSLEPYAEILESNLGWDVTDFNLGNFAQTGLTLFTLRNQSEKNGKPYAEKIMLVKQNQVTPMHYHWKKMEDIINRGGGVLSLQLYKRDETTDLLDEVSAIEVSIDGERRQIAAGDKIRLHPGQSICLPPTLYHSFWAEEGDVLAGEVSMANDDLTDNRFLDPLGRFSTIEEDETPIHLLCSDYKEFLCR